MNSLIIEDVARDSSATSGAIIDLIKIPIVKPIYQSISNFNFIPNLISKMQQKSIQILYANS